MSKNDIDRILENSFLEVFPVNITKIINKVISNKSILAYADTISLKIFKDIILSIDYYKDIVKIQALKSFEIEHEAWFLWFCALILELKQSSILLVRYQYPTLDKNVIVNGYEKHYSSVMNDIWTIHNLYSLVDEISPDWTDKYNSWVMSPKSLNIELSRIINK